MKLFFCPRELSFSLILVYLIDVDSLFTDPEAFEIFFCPQELSFSLILVYLIDVDSLFTDSGVFKDFFPATWGLLLFSDSVSLSIDKNLSEQKHFLNV